MQVLCWAQEHRQGITPATLSEGSIRRLLLWAAEAQQMAATQRGREAAEGGRGSCTLDCLGS